MTDVRNCCGHWLHVIQDQIFPGVGGERAVEVGEAQPDVAGSHGVCR